MKKSFSLLLALLLISSALQAHKPQSGHENHRAEKSAGQWLSDGEQVYNPFTRKLLAQGRLSVAVPSGATVEGALEYLGTQEYHTKVKGDKEHFQLTSYREGIGTKHFSFEEIHHGVAVFPGIAVVSFNSQNKVSFFHQNLFGLKQEINTIAQISEARALELASQAIHAQSAPMVEPTAKLVIWIETEAPVLVWKINIALDNPLGDWQIMVDAQSGEILEIEDKAVFENGTGFVFNPDPLTSAGVAYGGNYSDGNDGDTQQLTAQRFLDTLRDITNTNGTYSLSGPWVQIREFEAPTSTPVTATHPDSFRYTRSQQGFEDVMVYFHIDKSQRWIQSLGFNNIQHGSIWADAHGLNGDDNSHYLAGPNRIAFGEGGVDDDEDADVIWHEYGHGIQYSQAPSWGGGESGSLGEGFGDFWAGSYSRSLYAFRSEWVFNWDGHNAFWNGRVLNSTQHYPESIGGGIHDDGQMWSRSLMDIWAVLGREVTDQIVLQAHFYVGNGVTMPSNAQAVIQADIELNNGDNLQAIYTSFIARGFVDENAAPDFALTFPGGGEILQVGDNVNLTWGRGFEDSTVTIEVNYNYPAGAWTPLFTGTANDGSQAWTVPNTLTTHLRMRLFSVGNPAATDTSDSDCSIIPVSSSASQYFETGLFPSPWTISNPDTDITWAEFLFSQNHSARLRCYSYSNAEGEQDWLISPRLDWSTATLGYISFSSSYDWTAGRYDTLKIKFSADNGESWPVTLFNEGGPGLANRNHNQAEDNPTRWERHRIDIPQNLFNNPTVKIAFIGINHRGDNLYLDSIDVIARSGNLAPVVASRVPQTLTSVPAGTDQLFAVDANDPDNDPIEYYWYVDGNPAGVDTFILPFFAEADPQVLVQCFITDGYDTTETSWEFEVTATAADERFSDIPTVFALNSAYPNPFNPSTTIRYDVPQSGLVKLAVYNLTGQEVAVIANQVHQPGRYSVSWNAAGHSSGIYFVRMAADHFTSDRKLLLLK